MELDKNKIISDFEPYFKDGLLSLKDPWEGNDNHILFTSTAFWILTKKFNLNFVEFGEFRDQVEELKLKRGLYMPFESWSERLLSHDELLGLGMINKEIASDLVYYGKRHLWIFNNRGLLKDIPIQWMGRFPTLIAYLYSRAGKIPFHPFCHMFAIGEFLFADRGTPKTTTSGKCRRFIMADHFYNHGFAPMKWAAKKYLQFLEREYGDVSGLYSVYFKEHPLTWATKGMRFYD